MFLSGTRFCLFSSSSFLCIRTPLNYLSNWAPLLSVPQGTLVCVWESFYHIPTNTWCKVRDDCPQLRSRIGHSMLFHPVSTFLIKRLLFSPRVIKTVATLLSCLNISGDIRPIKMIFAIGMGKNFLSLFMQPWFSKLIDSTQCVIDGMEKIWGGGKGGGGERLVFPMMSVFLYSIY